jgi:hypothetical protein
VLHGVSKYKPISETYCVQVLVSSMYSEHQRKRGVHTVAKNAIRKLVIFISSFFPSPHVPFLFP